MLSEFSYVLHHMQIGQGQRPRCSGELYEFKACASFIKTIGDVTRRTVIENLEGSNFFSFTIDGATDFTGDDLENLYMRTCIKGES